MISRRGFFQSVIATLITAPLVRLGWKSPTLMKFRVSGHFASQGQKIGDVIYLSKGWADPIDVRPGDIVTIAGVYQENPRHY